jgi:hypothetical protein
MRRLLSEANKSELGEGVQADARHPHQVRLAAEAASPPILSQWERSWINQQSLQA